MIKTYVSKLFFCCFILLFLILNSVPGYAQLTLASNKSVAALYRQQPQQSYESKMALKDALDNLKRLYSVQIAYQEGLLDNKFISVSDESNLKQLGPEGWLKQLLPPLKLDYKKISNSQFSIFPLTNVVEVKEATQQAIRLRGVALFDEDGSPVIGGSIVLKGNPKVGTTTSVDGSFTLSIPDEYAGKPFIIVASFINYKPEEVTITNPALPVTIRLKQKDNALNEVVVTALGIKKERKSVGYSVTEVKGSEFVEARENNIGNALSGKIAGVNGAGLSTGPGGSSRIIIRGNGGLAGDNQPLYVINGMPIDNSVPGGASTINGITSNVDRGDGIAALNPDDIESITVLKGGQAAALYGARAGNGVILITTKKGSVRKGIGVEFNSTAQFDNAAVLPDYQYEYGQGDGGVKPTTLAAAQSTGRRSWGSKIDGSTDYVAADGLTHSYSPQRDNIKNFYQTGNAFTNSAAFSGGTEKVTYRFSAANLNSRGILPSTTYGRKTFNLALNGKLSDKITIDATVQYNIEKGHNRTGAGDALNNPNWTPLLVANTVDVRWLNPGYDAKGNETLWNDATVATNGYFVINKSKEDDVKNRFIGQGSVAYEPIKNLLIKATLSRDFYNYNYTNILPYGGLYIPLGEYKGIKSDVSETNLLGTINYKNKITRDFDFSVLVGGNKQRREENTLNLSGSQYIIPYFYSFSNLTASSTTPYNGASAINSVFGSADFNYKSLIFLTFTGRNDWFSTLNPADNSVFYPSIGGSFILSDAVKLPEVFNYAKLRASWAQVGGGLLTPYQTNLTYSNVPSSGPPLQNVTVNSNGTPLSSLSLHPYLSTTYEAGLEVQMLKNRLSFDITLYQRQTKDDIVSIPVSGSAGYNAVYYNIGKVRNRGVEFLVSGSPVKGKDFSWNASYNFAFNDNVVLQLAPDIKTYQLAVTVGNWGYLNNTVGQSFGTLVGSTIKKDAAGNVVFNATSGYPVAVPLQNLGKSVPPITMGLTNDFRYKRFSLSTLLDAKFGNKIFSIMEVYATRLGLMKSTLPGRENGLTVTGVDQAGNPYSRTVPISGLRVYYDNNKNYSELFVHDGSFVKLRQVILSYSIPVSGLKLLNIQSASIGFVARNLATLYKRTPNFDPEQSYTNSNNQGFESIGLPRTRSVGVNLMVKF